MHEDEVNTFVTVALCIGPRTREEVARGHAW